MKPRTTDLKQSFGSESLNLGSKPYCAFGLPYLALSTNTEPHVAQCVLLWPADLADPRFDSHMKSFHFHYHPSYRTDMAEIVLKRTYF